MQKLKLGKAAGPDGVANEAIKMSAAVACPYIEHLFAACLRHSYHPTPFRQATIITLRKPDKDTYRTPKSWRPIALLSCLGKLLEKIVAIRLTDIVSEHNLLPRIQFGGPGRDTTRALQFLLNIIHTGRAAGTRRRTSILSLDLMGAFDRIGRAKLLETLLSMRIPDWIILFVYSFISQRRCVLVTPGFKTEHFWVNVGIPQGSPISPILFLLFMSPLVSNLSPQTEDAQMHFFAYMDDCYLVATSASYETNCASFVEVHGKLIAMAEKRDMTFSPSKYAVMHIKSQDRGPKEGYDLIPDIPGLEGRTDVLKTDMRILGIQIDHHLRWGPQINSIVQKANRQLNYECRLSGSTWGASLSKMRTLYIIKIRPILSYACAAWWVPRLPGQKISYCATKGNIQRLERVQGRCLLKIAGAMSSKTSRLVLRKELHIESMEVFLERTVLAQWTREAGSLWRREFQADLKGRVSSSRHRYHPYYHMHKYAMRLREEAKMELLESDAAATPERLEEKLAQWDNPVSRSQIINRFAKQRAERQSQKEWHHYIASCPSSQKRPPIALLTDWGRESLKWYTGLDRAQSSILFQCRTEWIGLARTLHRLKVEGYKVS